MTARSRRAAGTADATAADGSRHDLAPAADREDDRAAASREPVFRTRGHARAVETVRTMLRRGMPHAILIGGPGGIGKTTLAIDLAAGLLCLDPDPAARPCRSCRGCRLVDRGIHPDLHRLAPAGPGDQIRIGGRDRPEDGTVRRLIADLVLLAVEGGARVAILERADRLTDDAQTALLKTLEEPPAGVTIVLCADDEDRLMPTVRSRAARIRLGPVAVREIESILAETGGTEPAIAARLARLSGGRPGRALQLAAAPDAITARDELARILLDLASPSASAPVAARLAAVKDLTARATDIDRALDRASRGEPAGRKAPTRRAAGSRSGSPEAPEAPEGGSPADAADDTTDGAEGAPATGLSVSAQERRRAALGVVGVWREVARDLAVVLLGAERQIRDPALLDDLRATATAFGPDGTAAIAAFLGRLDDAAELLEANVRPELVLDGLVLGWPRGQAS
jgi:DNA polymerase-3 subunit delta'